MSVSCTAALLTAALLVLDPDVAVCGYISGDVCGGVPPGGCVSVGKA